MTRDWLIERAFAHKGLQGPQTGFVENSLSAFRAAMDQGYGIELDVQLSRDDRAMVIHDPTLDRLTGDSGPVIERAAAALSKLVLGDGPARIPTLDQVFDLVDGRTPILVELKGDQGQFDRLAKAVWQDLQLYKGPVAVMSLYQGMLAWYRHHAPSVTCGFIATDIHQGDYPPVVFSWSHHIEVLCSLNLDFLAYDINALPNQATAFCGDHQIPVLTGVVTTAAEEAHARTYADNFIFDLYSP